MERTFDELVELYDKAVKEAYSKLPPVSEFDFPIYRVPVIADKYLIAYAQEATGCSTTDNPNVLIIEFEKQRIG